MRKKYFVECAVDLMSLLVTGDAGMMPGHYWPVLASIEAIQRQQNLKISNEVAVQPRTLYFK